LTTKIIPPYLFEKVKLLHGRLIKKENTNEENLGPV